MELTESQLNYAKYLLGEDVENCVNEQAYTKNNISIKDKVKTTISKFTKNNSIVTKMTDDIMNVIDGKTYTSPTASRKNNEALKDVIDPFSNNGQLDSDITNDIYYEILHNVLTPKKKK